MSPFWLYNKTTKVYYILNILKLFAMLALKTVSHKTIYIYYRDITVYKRTTVMIM